MAPPRSALLALHLRLGLPPHRPSQQQLFGLSFDLRITRLDLFLGGALALGILWLAIGKGSPTVAPAASATSADQSSQVGGG